MYLLIWMEQWDNCTVNLMIVVVAAACIDSADDWYYDPIRFRYGLWILIGILLWNNNKHINNIQPDDTVYTMYVKLISMEFYLYIFFCFLSLSFLPFSFEWVSYEINNEKILKISSLFVWDISKWKSTMHKHCVHEDQRSNARRRKKTICITIRITPIMGETIWSISFGTGPTIMMRYIHHYCDIYWHIYIWFFALPMDRWCIDFRLHIDSIQNSMRPTWIAKIHFPHSNSHGMPIHMSFGPNRLPAPKFESCLYPWVKKIK